MKKVAVLCLLLVGILTIKESAYAISVGASAPGKYDSEGNCTYGDRLSAPIFADKFTGTMEDKGNATIKFNYKNNSAWEQDMKPGSWSNDSVDDVNFALYVGHGLKISTNGLANNSLHYYTQNSYTNHHASGTTGEKSAASNLLVTEATWGASGTQTKWVALFACNFLNPMGGYLYAMNGIHACMGFQSSMWINSEQGRLFANYMCIDDGSGQPKKITASFMESCEIYQKSEDFSADSVTAVVIYAGGYGNDRITQYSSSRPAPLINQTSTYYKWTKIIYNNTTEDSDDTHSQIV